MKTQTSDVEDEIEAHTREMLRLRLGQCTARQQAFFDRIFPKGVPKQDLVAAIALCDRSIAFNVSEKAGGGEAK